MKIDFTLKEIALILDSLFIVEEISPTEEELAIKKSIEDKIHEVGHIDEYGKFIKKE